MRFMVMHKVDPKMEAGAPPDDTIIQNMGKLVGRSIKAGIFVDGEGLHRSAARARVSFNTDGAPVVTRGPYAGGNELLASFARISTTGIERAIELATVLGEAAGKREIEVGPIVERWDLFGGKRPDAAPFRFLLFVKADAAFEQGKSEIPTPAMRALFDAWKRDGVLQTEATLAPSRGAARSKVVDGKRAWIDGPFAESKELVAGFSILEVPSIDEAKQFTVEYATILGDNEVDIREVIAK